MVASGIVKRIRRSALTPWVVMVAVLRLLWLRRQRPRGVPTAGHFLLAVLPKSILSFLREWGFDVFFGDYIHAVADRTLYDCLHKLHENKGRTVALKPPMAPWIVQTRCPKNVEHILRTNFENYPKGELFRSRLQELLGNGIFNSDGQQWFHQRKISSHMFTANLFKEHIWVVVRRNARKLRDVLGACDPEKPVDVYNLMNRFTLDSIGEIGFGKCIGSLEDPSSPFLRSFDKAQLIAFWRFENPLWRLLRRFGLFTERETAEHFGCLDTYSRSVVRELVKAMEPRAHGKGAVAWGDLEARKSFVGMFIVEARKRGEILSEDYLRDLVLNFLIAGRDTTAQALSWTIFCLCQNPAVEAKARQEVLDVCGLRGPSYEDMSQLRYLNAVISEALRLYPSVPIDVKCAVNDDVWPDGTFVPAGTMVNYNIYSMGRDTGIWGSDAHVFRPERWLEEESSVIGNYEYPVFNAGPRECLGRRLAMVEMKTCLAMILPQVSFKLAVPADRITPAAQLTIGMGSGLPCFVTSVDGYGQQNHDSQGSSTCDSEYASSLSGFTDTASDTTSRGDELSDYANDVNGDTSDCSAQHGQKCRRRSKPRRSGRTRQRQKQFWQEVRQPTPERSPIH